MLIWYTYEFKYSCSGSQRSQCHDMENTALGYHSALIIAHQELVRLSEEMNLIKYCRNLRNIMIILNVKF